MTKLSKTFVRRMESQLPGFTRSGMTFLQHDGVVVRSYLIDTTPSFFRLYENLTLLAYRPDLSILACADRIAEVERDADRDDVERIISEAISSREADVARKNSLARLIQRQASQCETLDASKSSPGKVYGQPRTYLEYTMALLLSGDALGCERAMVETIALLAFHHDGVDPRGSVLAENGIRLGTSLPYRVAYPFRDFELQVMQDALTFCIEFERDANQVRDALLVDADRNVERLLASA
ncbi:hypothetical protein L2Y96_00205 [Luteibacter aegosomaticola]|uniref:hypothetical protein n=1 Tax=Luteibacter aegosomaticola TaxID=2911538 RepID=UPI001FF84358|nr:hypothetical protein [Luteibacter aegosomaticola]UPG90227.1 hypothetical protein L2Y96_00205 [Luteibacter aegosomaticola]